MPQPLSHEQKAMLVKLEHATFCRGGMGLPKSPLRDQLKRVGYIKSGPANPLGLRAKGGKGGRWYITDAGRAALAESA